MQDVLDKLAADIAATTDVAFTGRVDGEGWVEATYGERNRHGFTASDEVWMVSVVQDDVIVELWHAWPTCGDHGHPRQVQRVDGVLVWACPKGEVPAVEVGRLEGGHARDA